MAQRTNLNLAANNYLSSEERIPASDREDNPNIMNRFLANVTPLSKDAVTSINVDGPSQAYAQAVNIHGQLRDLATQNIQFRPLYYGIVIGNVAQVVEYISNNLLSTALRGSAVVCAAQLGHDNIVNDLLGQGKNIYIGSGDISPTRRSLALRIAAENRFFRTINVLLTGSFLIFDTDIEEIKKYVFTRILRYNNEIDCRIFEKFSITFNDIG